MFNGICEVGFSVKKMVGIWKFSFVNWIEKKICEILFDLYIIE